MQEFLTCRVHYAETLCREWLRLDNLYSLWLLYSHG